MDFDHCRHNTSVPERADLITEARRYLGLPELAEETPLSDLKEMRAGILLGLAGQLCQMCAIEHGRLRVGEHTLGSFVDAVLKAATR